ncbi:uncharacterized protein LOC125945521 isoform X3 [Dermacentor silvarum]|uniref:uncharacterized protein LOC125945521 isoform X1 n=1 Tax=Dermacentor silvarum TaxID=543639 RepID=UPI002101CE0A|nr:uncharacterized protein LOC125945521 isoform X1 [Dermacentor silvarum]XP_049523292.1 uncharacterized protein LOC125945521 isoform X2 [Dermacentor silvarum]XP_049523293.1 uncharacterized protein LOC125945521 isoform X3 [Dermacentor silvarum]
MSPYFLRWMRICILSLLATHQAHARVLSKDCVVVYQSMLNDPIVDDRVESAKCKPYESYGCVGDGPHCGENKCGEGPDPAGLVCNFTCVKGCWCHGNLYRRAGDGLCVTISEC